MILNNRYSLHVELRKRAKDAPTGTLRMVEIGLGFGDYATHLLDSVGDVVHLTSVESWRGRFMKRRMIDCRQEVLQRMEPYFDSAMYSYRVLELDSTAASKEFDDNSLDCVYIDAGHDYRNCINDIRRWYPKLKSGGIFSGHDYKKSGVPGVRTAVDEFFAENNLTLSVTQDVNPNPSWYTIKP